MKKAYQGPSLVRHGSVEELALKRRRKKRRHKHRPRGGTGGGTTGGSVDPRS